MRFTSYSTVRAVLTTDSFEVPPLPATDPAVTGVGWLRSQVARFSNGSAHQRRRSLAVAQLAAIAPSALEAQAADRTARVVAGADTGPFDLLAVVARVVPVEVLAGALGLPTGLADPVTTVARVYLPPAIPDRAADQAVAALVTACGGEPDEPTAARIGLLVQATVATAGLVGNAARSWLSGPPAGPAAAALAQTLRHDPPVRLTRRLASAPVQVGSDLVPAGTLAELDLAAAAADGDVPAGGQPGFGHGRHACPGREHALAIAAGVLEGIRGCRLLDADLPHRLLVAAR